MIPENYEVAAVPTGGASQGCQDVAAAFRRWDPPPPSGSGGQRMWLCAHFIVHGIRLDKVRLGKALNFKVEPPEDEELVHFHLRRHILHLSWRFI